MVYKLWRTVQLFSAEVEQPTWSHFPEATFRRFCQVFLFLMLILETKAANFYFNYFNYSSMHTE